MSKRNGDRARAQREQQKKLLRRQRTLGLRQNLQNKPTVATAQEAVTTETKLAPAD